MPHQPEDLTPAQREKQASFESLDYYKNYSSMYLRHLWRAHLHPERDIGTLAHQLEQKATVTRWLLHLAIAAVVGFVATGVLEGISFFEDARIEATAEAVRSHGGNSAAGYFSGLGVWLFSALGLVLFSTCVVVFFEPAAGGSGIPEVMAFLNGVAMPKVVSLTTFVGKILSCVAAVSAGLPVGAEAPLIHLGAIVGAGVPQGRSRALRCQTNLFQELRNHKSRRDFVTAGAACGVSAAFGAPIGGLLFVMEEVSSFWELASTAQVFVGTMVCFTTMALLNSVVDGSANGFVSHKASVMFEVEYAGDTALNVASIFPAAVLGLLAGLLAVVFTKGNLYVVKWRRQHIKPFRLRRVLEPLGLILVYGFLSYTLPFWTSCVPTQRPRTALAQNVTEGLDVGGSSSGDGGNAAVQTWHTENGTKLATYLCDSPGEYNPLATLTTTGIGKGSIRRLFSRRTVHEFPLWTLLVFLTLYFVFAFCSGGSAIASGMVIPMLVIGATVGRIYGLVLVDLFADEVHTREGSRIAAYVRDQAWMDPGVFALIGAGAFFGGVSRMTISLAVIMVELSGELHYLLPIMVAIVVARSVADALCEPLYHAQMNLDFVPYLPHEVPPGVSLELLSAGDVCSDGAVCLDIAERVSVVIDALQTTHHHFPVLDGRSFVGTVSREDLQVLLALPAFQVDMAQHDRHVVGRARRGSRSGGGGGVDREETEETETEDKTDAPPATAAAVVSVPTRYEDWLQHQQALFFVQGSHEWHRNWSPDGIARRERDRVSTTNNRGGPPPPPTEGTTPASRGPPEGSNGDDSTSRFGSFKAAFATAAASSSPPADSFFPDLPRDDSIKMNLDSILNRSPWTVRTNLNAQLLYLEFRSLGLRTAVVVDGDRVVGVVTRKSLLAPHLREATRRVAHRLGHLSGGGGGGGFDSLRTRSASLMTSRGVAADSRQQRGSVTATALAAAENDGDEDDGGDDEDDEGREVRRLGGGMFGAVKAFFAPRYRVTEDELSSGDEELDSPPNLNSHNLNNLRPTPGNGFV